MNRNPCRPAGGADDCHLPTNVFRYVAATSGWHQLLLVALTVTVFLLEVVPLEIQRRAIDDLAKHRAFGWIVLLAGVYAGSVLVQGGIKLVLNICRGWVGEQAKRDLRRRIAATGGRAPDAGAAAEAQGIAVAMIVAEVEPIGGFVGASISEPLLQAGILLSVLAYIVHIDVWMALAAFLIFVPEFAFVPLFQRAMNRRAGARVRILRQLGAGVIAVEDAADAPDFASDRHIDRVFALAMGIFRIKFAMNFLMNLGSHFQIVAALVVGGWAVHTQQLAIGGIVAFISGIGRLTDPWGDLVNYFHDVNFAQVKFRLLAEAVNAFFDRPPAPPSFQAEDARLPAA